MLKFIHAADIHLDSPLRGLERYEGAPADEIRAAVRRSLDNLIGLATRENVAFVLIAGDIYDGDWGDHKTGLYFVTWLSRLHAKGISVYAISGNHDAENKMTKFLHLPLNPCGNAVMLSSTQVETIQRDDIGVAIHGRGFADQEERGNLVLQYPDAIAGLFNIGMLHTSLDGSPAHIVGVSASHAISHKTYAPCSPADLRSRGYQYWALGHIHTRKHYHAKGETPIVFPGNVQGRHIRETGPKGCELVSVSDGGDVAIEFHSLDVFRFELCNVAVDGVEEPAELVTRFVDAMRDIVAQSDGLPMAVRVEVSGASIAHDQWLANLEDWIASIRGAAISISRSEIWIEKVRFRTRALQQLTAEDIESGPIAELLRYFEDLREDDRLMSELSSELDELRRKLPSELCEPEQSEVVEAVAPREINGLRPILDQIRPMLIHRLQSEEFAR